MKRILCVLPIPYGPNWGFWTRDAGLMVLTLRGMGYDAWLVALGDASTDTTNRPVMAVSLEDLRRPDWWQAQKPDAVVLSTGSAPRHDALRKAALSATPRVIERLDTDGIRSARLWPRYYFIHAIGEYRDRLPANRRWLAPLVAAMRTVAVFLFPQLLDTKMVATMRQLPAVSAESPVAVENIQKMFETFGGKRHQVAMIPHPVDEAMRYDAGTPRENRLIAVGRWDNFQKDYPLLRKVVKGFLERHPDWTATIVGGGVPADDLSAESMEERLSFHQQVGREQMVQAYNRSKIYVMVSRYEGFSVAASEALCCGCSVVSARELATSTYTAQDNSGGIAETRDTAGFAVALDNEVKAWTNGERKPAAIAAIWRDRLGAQAVTRATIALLETIPARVG